MNGNRLRLARKRAGLSMRGLSDRLGGMVSAQAIAKYENGKMSPGSEVFDALAESLGVSRFYLMAPRDIELGKLEFRTRSNTGAKDRARVETGLLERVERYLQIEEILGLDSARWNCPRGMPMDASTGGEAEIVADALREAWGLGRDPIPNITEILEENGVKAWLADLPERVSGLTCEIEGPDGNVPVIVVNGAHGLERRRFTLAHELGHRVIRCGGGREAENICQRFAGAFLVNREHLRREVGERRSAVSYGEIMDLKRLYRVSAAALVVRLEQAGIVGRSYVEYVFRTFGRGWRKSEPDGIEPPVDRGRMEAASRFERLVCRALSEDLISMSKAVELLGEPVAAIRERLRGPAPNDADHR